MFFGFVVLFALAVIPLRQFVTLNASNYLWLGISGLATALSWIFYYKALKDGEVSTIALIDKGSILVAILLAAVILKEQITPRILVGGALVLSGIVVIARK